MFYIMFRLQKQSQKLPKMHGPPQCYSVRKIASFVPTHYSTYGNPLTWSPDPPATLRKAIVKLRTGWNKKSHRVSVSMPPTTHWGRGWRCKENLKTNREPEGNMSLGMLEDGIDVWGPFSKAVSEQKALCLLAARRTTPRIQGKFQSGFHRDFGQPIHDVIDQLKINPGN
ncbi:hypothetical protein DFH09DRAFT_1083652 [Mycena vulgaris]|nr:hypothetical protein DFH09DRAFT_1083652 [Mycena vulgaris]